MAGNEAQIRALIGRWATAVHGGERHSGGPYSAASRPGWLPVHTPIPDR